MKKYRISNNGIDNNRYRKKKECEKRIDSILYQMKESHDDKGSVKLASVIDELSIHWILIIVEHISLFWNNRIKSLILIKRNIIYTEWFRKGIFSRVLYKTHEIWISFLHKSERFPFWYRIDGNTSKCILESCGKSSNIYILNRISTLEANRKRDTAIHRTNKFFRSKKH